MSLPPLAPFHSLTHAGAHDKDLIEEGVEDSLNESSSVVSKTFVTQEAKVRDVPRRRNPLSWLTQNPRPMRDTHDLTEQQARLNSKRQELDTTQEELERTQESFLLRKARAKRRKAQLKTMREEHEQLKVKYAGWIRENNIKLTQARANIKRNRDDRLSLEQQSDELHRELADLRQRKERAAASLSQYEFYKRYLEETVKASDGFYKSTKDLLEHFEELERVHSELLASEDKHAENVRNLATGRSMEYGSLATRLIVNSTKGGHKFSKLDELRLENELAQEKLEAQHIQVSQQLRTVGLIKMTIFNMYEMGSLTGLWRHQAQAGTKPGSRLTLDFCLDKIVARMDDLSEALAHVQELKRKREERQREDREYERENTRTEIEV